MCSLRILKLEAEGRKIETETFTVKLKTQVKILFNPGLAKSGLEEPGPFTLNFLNLDRYRMGTQC